MSFLYKITLIILVSAWQGQAAEKSKKIWHTYYSGGIHPKEISEDSLNPAFHNNQPQNARWEIFLGFDGKESPNYRVPIFDLEQFRERLIERKEGLTKPLEVWLENIVGRGGVMYYRVTAVTNISKKNPDGSVEFRKGADFFWVSGLNLRRIK